MEEWIEEQCAIYVEGKIPIMLRIQECRLKHHLISKTSRTAQRIDLELGEIQQGQNVGSYLGRYQIVTIFHVMPSIDSAAERIVSKLLSGYLVANEILES